MESTSQYYDTKSNYQFLNDKYTLPVWFDYSDIDWVRY